MLIGVQGELGENERERVGELAHGLLGPPPDHCRAGWPAVLGINAPWHLCTFPVFTSLPEFIAQPAQLQARLQQHHYSTLGRVVARANGSLNSGIGMSTHLTTLYYNCSRQMIISRRSAVYLQPSLLECVLFSPVKFLLSLLYKLSLSLRSTSPSRSSPVRIVCISDTHTLTYEIPEGDILIHAGDLTNAGTVSEIQGTIDWLASLPHRHKVAIAGNHDTYLDPRSRVTLSKADQEPSLNWHNITYLQHDSTTITVANRALHIYGAPQIPSCGGPEFAFQYHKGQDAWTNTIPANVDVLVTHTPPKFHLDVFSPSLGCEWLLKECWRVKPRLHVFGHIHADAGRQVVFWDDAQRAYERGMTRKGEGFLAELFNPWLWMDVAKLLFYGTTGLLWNRVWVGEQRSTVLINAALMKTDGKLGNEVQVIDV